MKNVFIVADNIISPLGDTTAENFSALTTGASGVRQHNRTAITGHYFYASLLDERYHKADSINSPFTNFEQLLFDSVTRALQNTAIDLADSRTILLISSTKGNIGLIENEPRSPELQKRVALHTSADLLAAHLNCINKPVVISNACISGLLALIIGKRLITTGQYDHVVVAGADVISKFVFSGFESFQAISSGHCRPFDADRNGINLGEGAGTIVLSGNEKYASGIRLGEGAVSNDANHISGPSRTGEELCHAMLRAIRDSQLTTGEIDLISAHGTATIYNDEMEALAISGANLQEVPAYSLKGYYGHTLGAAGIIESIISAQSLQQNLVLASPGYSRHGVSKPVNISTALHSAVLRNCLKTAAGFGGCNAAILLHKE